MIKADPGLFNLMELSFSDAIQSGVKELLETKHLYQNHRILFPAFDEIYQSFNWAPSIVGGVGSRDASRIHQEKRLRECKLIYDNVGEFEWQIINPKTTRKSSPVYSSNVATKTKIQPVVTFAPPSTIKIFCSKCKSVQPYNIFHATDITKQLKESTYNEYCVDVQIYLLAYQCQSCKGIPEVFMIRREKTKLIQSGRTPMEQVETPRFIPNGQKKYFSDAIIAFNSGQVLAGKFLLRTFIEQFVRCFLNDYDSQSMDEVFDTYAKSLPDDLKERFPSLSSVYSKLSDDIHKADEDINVFEEAKKDIEEHFEIKKVFNIPNENSNTK